MGRLAGFVHIYDERGTLHSFGPDDAVPEWAEKRITNPRAWEGGTAPAGPKSEDGGGTAPAGQPPRTGKGSGHEHWADYAASIGIDPEGMSREEIIEAVEAAAG